MRDALLQPLLGLEQSLFMAFEIRDVRIGGDEAAARHGLTMNAVHLSVAAYPLKRVGGAGTQVREPLFDLSLGVARSELAARSVPSQQFDDWAPDGDQSLGVLE